MRTERFLFQPPSGFIRLAVASGGFIGLVVLAIIERGATVPWDLVAMVAALAMVPLLAAVALGAPSGQRALDVLEDRLHVPYGARALRTIVIRFTEIESLYLRAGPRGFMVLRTPYARLVFHRRSFGRADDLDRLHALIRSQIEGILSSGPTRVERLDAEERAFNRAYATKPVVTLTTMAALLVVYFFEQYAGAFSRLYATVPLQAGARILIDEGQVFRSVSATFIHGSAMHIGLVLVMIFAFGRRIEGLFGARHTLLVILAATLVGGAFSAVSMGQVVFLGAQTIAFGLLGATALVTTKHWRRLPFGFDPPNRWWGFVGGCLVVMMYVVGDMDVPGELGGLLAGVVVASLVLVRSDPSLPNYRVSSTTSGLTVLMSIGTAVCVALAIQHGTADEGADETRVIRHHLETSVGDQALLNRIAWEIATDPASPNDRLVLARTAIERALERSRDQLETAAFEDTYATVLHRLGDADAAVAHELIALAATDGSFMASQLARFATAASAPIDLPGAPTSSVSVTLVEHENRGFGVRVVGTRTATAAHTLYLVARHGPKVAGLLRMTIDRDTPEAETIWLAKRGAPATWPSGVTLDLVIRGPRTAPWRAWSMEPEAAALP